MATHTFVPFDLAEASDLADLTGIRYDLESACALAEELKSTLVDILDGGNSRPNVLDALSTAVLVRYCRPFSSGVRRKSLKDNILAVLNKNQRAKHEHLQAFRDKHIAHSVNAYEENQPVARYVVERVHHEGVYAVECHHSRVVGLSSTEVEYVIELTTTMLRYVYRALESEKQQLLEKVRAIPLENLLSGDSDRTIHTLGADIRRRRNR